MKLHNFYDLFMVLLSDAYLLERQAIQIFPQLIQKAYSRELKNVLQEHFVETGNQLKRIEMIFEEIQEKTRFLEWSNSLKALFTHAEEFLQENPQSMLLDAAIILFVQKIEHMEMATFGTLKEFADVIELSEIKKILKEAVKEAQRADVILSKLAKGKFFSPGINIEAAKK